MSSNVDLKQVWRTMHDAPSEKYTLSLPMMEVGAMVRKTLRAAFDVAKIKGAEVEVHEQKSVLSSLFTVKLAGDFNQLDFTVRTLIALTEKDES